MYGVQWRIGPSLSFARGLDIPSIPFCAGSVKREGLSRVSTFERKRSRAVSPPWRRSFQQSRELRSGVSLLGTFGFKEAFQLWERQTILPRCFQGRCLRFSQGKPSILPGLLVSGGHAVISPALDNLSIGKSEKRRQDPLLGCCHTENSYHQSGRPTYRCTKILRSTSPKQLPISFEQTLLERKIFLL